MAKKSKKAAENTKPAENTVTPEVTNEVTNEVAPEVTPSEVAPEVKDENVEAPTGIEHRMEQPKKEIKVQPVPYKVVSPSMKQTFEKMIEKTPYSIFQNGILICHHSAFTKIIPHDTYFEINFRKFSYAGIEIKYI